MLAAPIISSEDFLASPNPTVTTAHSQISLPHTDNSNPTLQGAELYGVRDGPTDVIFPQSIYLPEDQEPTLTMTTHTAGVYHLPEDQGQGYIPDQSQGYMADQSQSYMADQSQGYMADQSQGYVPDQGQGFVPDQSHGYQDLAMLESSIPAHSIPDDFIEHLDGHTTNEPTHHVDDPVVEPEDASHDQQQLNIGDIEDPEVRAFRNAALGVKRYFCDLCEFGSFFESTLELHKIQDHHGGLSYLCDVCGYRYCRGIDLDTHLRTVHQRVDNVSGGKRKNRQLHCFSWKRETRLVCDECGNCFDEKTQLLAHQQLHRMKNCNMCSICNELFVSMDKLSRHIREFHTEGEEFLSDDNLDPQVTEEEGKQHKCRTCGLFLDSVISLRRHEEAHQKDILHPIKKRQQLKRRGLRIQRPLWHKLLKMQTMSPDSPVRVFHTNYLNVDGLKLRENEVEAMIEEENLRQLKGIQEELKEIEDEGDQNREPEAHGEFDDFHVEIPRKSRRSVKRPYQKYRRYGHRHKCPVCREAFQYRSEVSLHMETAHSRIHDGCELGITEEEVAMEMRRSHRKRSRTRSPNKRKRSVPKSVLKCLICGMRFSEKHELRSHVSESHSTQVHSVPTPLTQSTARKAKHRAVSSPPAAAAEDKTAGAGQDHLNTTGEFPEFSEFVDIDVDQLDECNMIDIMTPEKSPRKQQQQPQQPKFQCPECPTQFVDIQAYKKHYHGFHIKGNYRDPRAKREKRFQCTLCDSAFTQSSNRTRHMVQQHGVHPGDKRLSLYRSKSSRTYSKPPTARSNRVRVTTPPKNRIHLQCDSCLVSFCSEKELASHVARYHGYESHHIRAIDDFQEVPPDNFQESNQDFGEVQHDNMQEPPQDSGMESFDNQQTFDPSQPGHFPNSPEGSLVDIEDEDEVPVTNTTTTTTTISQDTQFICEICGQVFPRKHYMISHIENDH